MNIESFLLLFERPRKTARGWSVRCPGHQDKNPSLAVSEGDDGRILLHCFSGCPVDAILQAMGLKISDLFPGDLPPKSKYEYSKKRTKKKAIDNIENSLAVIFRKSEAIIRAATGIDPSIWNQSSTDRAMNIVADAHSVLWREELKELNRG